MPLQQANTMYRFNNRILAGIRGAGSLLDIAPSTRYDVLVPNGSFNERLRDDFLRVGGAMRHAMDRERMTNGATGQGKAASPRDEKTT